MKMHSIHFENIYTRFICLFLLFNGLFLTIAFGQNIPDDRFAEAIRAVCPTCIDNANNLLPPATSLIELDVRGKNISLLTGVEGFTSLQNLFCSSNSIINVPTLPSTLKFFTISFNAISSLPTLPSGLEKLYCINNTLTSLPTLPSSLVQLYIQNNQVTTLPTLPSSLIELDVDNNRLTTLPILPSSLRILYAGGNQMTTLPSLPNGLQYFSCWSNQITALPTTLPSGLIDLTCQNNPLSSLPSLPSTLRFLGCHGTAINCLPTLPDGLTTLQLDPTRILCLPNTPTNCTINNGASTTDIRSSFSVCGPKITDVNFANAIRTACPTCIDGCNNLAPAAASLTTLDVNSKNIVSLAGLEGFTHLETLFCYNNSFSSLPTLPSTLKILYCGFSNLTSLPTLPNSLQQLLCPKSQLASLPTLPSGLLQLYVDNNRLTSLPALPNGLSILYTGGNQLTTLPTLPSNLIRFSCWSNQITALPNTLPSGLLELGVYNNPLSNLPNLPSNLQHLSCYATNITCLPTLPTTLTELLLDPTKITCLPNSPTNLAIYNGTGTTNIRNTFSFCAPPNIVIHPSVTNPVCVGNTITLTAKATSTKTMTVKWQLKRSTDVNYVDLTTATNYTSGTDATYNLTFTANDNGANIRAVFSALCIEWETNAAPIFLSNGIHIADVGFANAIYRNCPACINECGDLTSAVTGVTTLDMTYSSIKDLTGLEAFTNLQNLYCQGNYDLRVLPNLPPNLLEISCGVNELTSLPMLPSGLTALAVYGSRLTSLPTLPNSLKRLWCYSNQLTSLPALPSGLTELECEDNQLTSLPTLPSTLRTLNCHHNALQSLPALPISLTYLDCYNNQLTNLPTLPNTLSTLNCWSNLLQNLPTLPLNLTVLRCQNNQLTSLPTLPTTLESIDCSTNQLQSLPNLPSSLKSLSCYQNNMYCFVGLPNSLLKIELDATKITCLPNFPTNVEIYDQNSSTNIRNNYGICSTNSLTLHPSVSNPVCVGSVVTLTAKAVGNNGMTVKWQAKRATDANYVEVVTPSTYASGTVASTNIVVENASNGNSYRAVFTTCSGELVTNAATLTTSKGLHIPNANFATAIRNACANCIDACDNLTTNAASLTTLNVSSSQINDLTGIEAFTSLQTLVLDYNPLSSLPNNLPNSLTTLSCRYLTINSLPSNLPSNLANLYCGNTFLNVFSATLPANLRTLDCSNAYLTTLPSTLPSGLLTLNCSSNQLTSLPDMPTTLLELNCNSNALTSLPPFYNKIQYLYCQNNKLTSLPSSLPADLKYLRCQNNRLTDLPSSLTPNILEIECYDNNIYCLPTLPNALTNLKLDKLKITCLPNIIAGLVIQNRDIAGDISSTYTLCTAPNIVMHPSVSGSPRIGQPTIFTVKATNNSVTSVKWQRRGASEANFSDITNSSLPYTTNTMATYTTPNLTTADIGASYRAVFTSPCSGDATTNAATLNIGVLPVELTEFTGKVAEKFNTLTWSVATQRNVSHFVVERTDNDTKNWTAIGQVASQNNSDYQFDDQQPLPLAYYRLVAVDLDGSVSYSKTISIDRQNLKNPKIKVYPNPATSDLTIEIPQYTDGTSRDNQEAVEIINAIGQVVFKLKTTGKNEVHIDINTWQSGVYFIRTTDATTLVKFIKN